MNMVDFCLTCLVFTIKIKVKYLSVYSLLNDKKKALKIFGPKVRCMKKPFGYQVAHHLYGKTLKSIQLN